MTERVEGRRSRTRGRIPIDTRRAPHPAVGYRPLNSFQSGQHMKSTLAAALVTAAFALAGTALPASAITFEHGSFLTNPEFSNGFDGFGTTGVVSGNSYSEGGITVTALGFATHGVNSVLFPWGGQLGPYNWYIGQYNGNPEFNYVVSIKLTDGRPFQALQFQMSSGASFSTFLGVSAWLNGQLVFADYTGDTGSAAIFSAAAMCLRPVRRRLRRGSARRRVTEFLLVQRQRDCARQHNRAPLHADSCRPSLVRGRHWYGRRRRVATQAPAGAVTAAGMIGKSSTRCRHAIGASSSTRPGLI